MILALYGACLLAIQYWQSKRISNLVAFSLLYLLSCFAIFSHKSFSFRGLPSIILLASFVLTGTSFAGLREIGKACIFPPFFTGICCLHVGKRFINPSNKNSPILACFHPCHFFLWSYVRFGANSWSCTCSFMDSK